MISGMNGDMDSGGRLLPRLYRNTLTVATSPMDLQESDMTTAGHPSCPAFSCKGRYFCPSCHMKRVLQFSEWLTTEVYEGVTHHQYVFYHS